MSVMIDTHVFISAVLFPNGFAAKALFKTLSHPYTPVTSDYVIEEMLQKMQEKFPHRMTEFKEFMLSLVQSIEIVATPDSASVAEQRIRDKKDRPILRAALSVGADILITGDKDFLEAAIDNPKIMSVNDFLLLN